LLLLGVGATDLVDGVRHELKDKVEVLFVGLIATRVEAVFEGHDARVRKDAHDLQLAILWRVRGIVRPCAELSMNYNTPEFVRDARF